jgi:hypothetical protein
MYPQLLELKSSKIFAGILIFIYGGSFICLNLSSLSIWIKIVLALIIAVSFLISLNKFILLRSADSILNIKSDKKNQWYLMNRSAELMTGQLCGDSICTRWLVILNFRIIAAKKKNLSLLIFPDSIDAENFRKLRAYLYIVSRKLQ